MHLQEVNPEPIQWQHQSGSGEQTLEKYIDQDNNINCSIKSNSRNIIENKLCNIEDKIGSNNSNNSANCNDIILDYNKEDDYVNSFLPITCYSILIAIGGLVFGYDIGTIGGIVDLPAFNMTYGNNETTNPHSFTPIVKGSIVSISSLGGFFSGLIAVSIIPIIGMRFTIFTSMLLYILGNFIILISNKWELILLGRSLNGTCIGLITITCPMYISEITPLKHRGLFTCFHQLFTTIGIVVGALTILYSSSSYFDTDVSQYEYPLIQGMILAFINACIIWIVPESPNWLVKKDKPIHKVKKSLSKIRNLSIDNEDITNSTAKLFDMNFQMNNIHTMKKQNSNSIIKGKPKYFQRTITGILLLGFQQFTGINYFFYYGITIFENIKLTTPYLVPVIFGVVNLLCSCLSIYIISIFNRKVLLIAGSFCMVVLMAIFTSIEVFVKVDFIISIILIIVSCLFISCFSLTWGPISSVLVSEMYPTNIKVKAMSICGSSCWIFNFIIALMIPILSSKIGFSLGYIFVGFLTISIPFTYYLVPETRNKSTARLDRIYETNKSKWGIVLQN